LNKISRICTYCEQEFSGRRGERYSACTAKCYQAQKARKNKLAKYYDQWTDLNIFTIAKIMGWRQDG